MGVLCLMKYYIISDTHFGHTKVAEFCNRPDNWEQRTITNMLNTLSHDHILIHLGDWEFHSRLEPFYGEMLRALPCKKILVKGNHDRRSYTALYEQGWDVVCSIFSIKYLGLNILFSHKPQDRLDILENSNIWDINIHGHFHNLSKERLMEKDRYNYDKVTDRHILYSLENEDYKPVELKKFFYREIKKRGIKL